MTIICDHPEHGEGPCAEHFGELMASAMGAAVAMTPGEMASVISHLGSHGWAGNALMTATALYARYGVPEGQSRECAADSLEFSVLNCGEDCGDAPAGELRWMGLYRMLVRAAVLRDADNLMAALTTTGHLDPVDMLGLVSSLLASTTAVVETSPHANTLTVGLYYLYGSQLKGESSWLALDDLVDATEAMTMGETQRSMVALRRISTGTGQQVSSTMALAVHAWAQHCDPDTEVVAGAGTIGGPAADEMILWRDEAADAGRTLQQKAAVWAMRFAAAHASGDTDAMRRWLYGAEPQEANVRALLAIYGCVVFLAQALREEIDQMRTSG